jgi:hypothetical protein
MGSTDTVAEVAPVRARSDEHRVRDAGV